MTMSAVASKLQGARQELWGCGLAAAAAMALLLSGPAQSQALPPSVRSAGVTVEQWALVRMRVRAAAVEKKVSEASLASVCEKVGIALANKGPVDLKQMIALIAAKADEISALDKRLSQLASQNDVKTALLLREARAAINRGDLDQADAILARARASARMARESAQRREAEVIAAEAKVKELRFDYIGAAGAYAEAVELLPATATGERYGYLVAQAGALRSRGEYFGDTAALAQAADAVRRAIASASRETSPADWAAAQSRLGVILRVMAAFGDEQALDGALDAFRSAMSVYTRAQYPREWARTQNDLGAALVVASARRNDRSALNDAVSAHQSALDVLTRDRDAADWAADQINLGVALQRTARFAEAADTKPLLNAAIAAERAALTVLSAEQDPVQWGRARNNLGGALMTLGEYGDAAAMRDAIATFRETTKAFTREIYPSEWAKLQANLGLAFRALYANGDEASGPEAVTSFRGALEVWSRKDNPALWAAAQGGLASVYGTMGLRGDAAALKDSIEAARLLTEPEIRRLAPFEWGSAQLTLGNSLEELGTKGDQHALEAAIAAYRSALDIFTAESSPVGHKIALDNLTRAQAKLETLKR